MNELEFIGVIQVAEPAKADAEEQSLEARLANLKR
jgi:hypothetical protein